MKSCDIFNIGGTGIFVNGGDRQTLTPSNHKIINNHLYNLATRSKTYNPGIAVRGVGQTIENNLIHECPHMGLSFNGNDHKIRYNEIYAVLRETSDSGAIYCGRNYTMRGTEISYNYLHDIQTSASTSGNLRAVAIYLDDQYSGTNVHHNIIRNANLALMLGGGHDNVYDSNIMIDCKISMEIDARGLGWAKANASPGGDAHITIFQVPYNKPPYTEKYPELAHILDMEVGIPKGNRVRDNLIINSGNAVIADAIIEYGSVGNNVTLKNFSDYNNMELQDYTVKNNAQILKILPSLEGMDMSQIGLKCDEYRTELSLSELIPFKQIAPRNGESGITNKSYLFRWDEVEGADRYSLVIANDAKLKSIVKKYNTVDNFANVTGLLTGMKNLYWKVTAHNDSRQLTSLWTSKGDPYLFTTAIYDTLDKTSLGEALIKAKQCSASIVEGDEAGQYKQGFKQNLDNAIARAEPIFSAEIGKQSSVDSRAAELNNIMDNASDFLNYQVVDFTPAFEKLSDWEHENETLSFESDGSLMYTDNIRKISGYKKEIGMADVLRFKLKYNTGTNYLAIALKQTDITSTVFANGKDAYLLVLKQDSIELQKRSSGTNKFLTVQKRGLLPLDTWGDVEFGAISTGIGNRILARVNGETIFDILDNDAPILSGNHFALYDSSITGYIALKAPTER